MPLQMLITNAGLDALVDAQGAGSDAIEITSMGLTAAPFVLSPTLTALPGIFKTLLAVSGQSVAANIIHLTAYDTSNEAYDVTGFGLFLSDGTLFAVYSAAADPVLSKTSLATALFAHDIKFANDIAAIITFGNAIFSYPPATETVKGVAYLASNALADAGVDDETIMTPALVARLIAAAVNAAVPPNIMARWHGSIATIPAGWILCDGQNGTPDLRDKFVVGAGGEYDVGETGGALTHGHISDLAAHALTIAEMPAHRHHVVVDALGNNNLTAGTSLSVQRSAGGDTEYVLNSAPGEPSIGRTSQMGEGTPHDHALTIDSANHLPPYYALAYIMKI